MPSSLALTPSARADLNLADIASQVFGSTLAATATPDLAGPALRWRACRARLDDPDTSQQHDCREDDQELTEKDDQREENDDQDPDRDQDSKRNEDSTYAEVVRERKVCRHVDGLPPAWPVPPPANCPATAIGPVDLGYSHSMVLGGFDEMSRATRLTAGISLMTRLEIVSSRS